jgi:hypothetical protein
MLEKTSEFIFYIEFLTFISVFQFLVYKAQHEEALQKDTAVVNVHNQQPEIREFLPFVSYAMLVDCSFLDLSATEKWMEKLIKKKKKQDGNLTQSLGITNSDHQDPFEEITRWFGSKRLEQAACPNPITWWGVSLFLYLKILSSCLLFSTSLNIQLFD